MKKKFLSLLAAALIIATPIEAMQRELPAQPMHRRRPDSCCDRITKVATKVAMIAAVITTIPAIIVREKALNPKGYVASFTSFKDYSHSRLDSNDEQRCMGNALVEEMIERYPLCPVECLGVSEIYYSFTGFHGAKKMPEERLKQLDIVCSQLSPEGGKRKICPMTHNQAEKAALKKSKKEKQD